MNKPKYQIGDWIRVINTDCDVPYGFVGKIERVNNNVKTLLVQFGYNSYPLFKKDVEKFNLESTICIDISNLR